MVRVRTHTLFPALPTFQRPRNIRCSICFLLQADSRTPREHTYRLFQPLERTSSIISSKPLGGYSIVEGCREPMLGRIAIKVKMKSCGSCSRTVEAIYLSNPESQCTMLSASCRLSMPGRFMPKGMRLGPANCAESIAASPSTTTRPLPKLIRMP